MKKILFILPFFLVACDKVTENKKPTPPAVSSNLKFYEGAVAKTSVDFGLVGFGHASSVSKTIKLVNEGSADTESSVVSISGLGFQLVSNNCPAKIKVNESCEVSISLDSSEQTAGLKASILKFSVFALPLAGRVMAEEVVNPCAENEHLDGSLCVANERACAELPEGALSGSEIYSSGSWGSCVASSCNDGAGYSLLGSENNLGCYTALSAGPEPVELLSGASYSFPVSGGKAPYSLSIVSTTIGSEVEGSVYLSGVNSGTDKVQEVVKITDAVGQELEMTVDVYPPMILRASITSGVTGFTSQLTVSGGFNISKVLSIVSSIGSSISQNGHYQSGVNSGTAEVEDVVRVTDAYGNMAEAHLIVRPEEVGVINPKLTVTKSSATGRVVVNGQEACPDQLSCVLRPGLNAQIYVEAYSQKEEEHFIQFSACPNPAYSNYAGHNVCAGFLLTGDMTVAADFYTAGGHKVDPMAKPLLAIDKLTKRIVSTIKPGDRYSYDSGMEREAYTNRSADFNTTNVSITPPSGIQAVTTSMLNSAMNIFNPSGIGEYLISLTKQAYAFLFKVKVYPSTDFGYGGSTDLTFSKLDGRVINSLTSAGYVEEDFQYDNTISVSPSTGNIFLMTRGFPNGSISIMKFKPNGKLDASFPQGVPGNGANQILFATFSHDNVIGLGRFGGLMSKFYFYGDKMVGLNAFTRTVDTGNNNIGTRPDVVAFQLKEEGHQNGTPSEGNASLVSSQFNSNYYITRGIFSGYSGFNVGQEFIQNISATQVNQYLYVMVKAMRYNIIPEEGYSLIYRIDLSSDSLSADPTFPSGGFIPLENSLISVSSPQAGFVKVALKNEISTEGPTFLKSSSEGLFLVGTAYKHRPAPLNLQGSKEVSAVTIAKMDATSGVVNNSVYEDMQNLSINPLAQDQGRIIVVGNTVLLNEMFEEDAVTTHEAQKYPRISRISFDTGEATRLEPLSTEPLTGGIREMAATLRFIKSDQTYVYVAVGANDNKNVVLARVNLLTQEIDPGYSMTNFIYTYRAGYKEHGYSIDSSDFDESNFYIATARTLSKVNILSGQLASEDQRSHIQCSGEREGIFNEGTRSCECVSEDSIISSSGICEPRAKVACAEANRLSNAGVVWDSLVQSCHCNDPGKFFNYESGQCEGAALICGVGYPNDEGSNATACMCPDGYFDTDDRNDISMGNGMGYLSSWDGDLTVCRPKQSLVNCSNDGGSYNTSNFEPCDCSASPMGTDYDSETGGCTTNFMKHACENGNGQWDQSMQYCNCYDFDSIFEQDQYGNYTCVNQAEKNCLESGGEWDGFSCRSQEEIQCSNEGGSWMGYCEFNCWQYDINSCGGSHCQWTSYEDPEDPGAGYCNQF